MKALVVNALGRGFDLEDVDIAAPMGRDVLVNVQASGPCHTDLLFATHDIVPTPAVLGHEVAGIVPAVGPDVAQLRVGDHVVGSYAGTYQAVTTPESNIMRAELDHKKDRLKLLLDMTNALVSNLEPRALLRAMSASIRQDIPCDAVVVLLPESDRRQLRLRALDFLETKTFTEEDSLQPIDGPEFVSVFKTGKPVVIGTGANAVSDQDTRVMLAEAIQSVCALPLISRNRTLGVLALGSRVENSFSAEDLDFLGRVAGQMAIAVESALAYREIAELKDKLAQEKLYLQEEIHAADFDGIVGQSSALRQVLQLVETVATSDSTVLLLGETGTGKELVARAIHDRSRRKERTLIKLNCAAIPTGLLESELIGHERGAFTGAVTQKIGRLELADQGTLFLDEIGDIPLELQPKLLRVLQDGEFERLGSTRTKKVDVRLVAATNRDLDRMIEDRQFRSDLYYRLNVFPIRVPPLRERPEDIPTLVRYFSQKYARRMEKRIDNIPAIAMRKLTRWHWPGNVRELQNLVERAVILTRGNTLAISVPELANGAATSAFPRPGNIDEQDRIMRILKETKGRVGGPDGAAARLGLKRTTLLTRMKRLGIDLQRTFNHRRHRFHQDETRRGRP
jgi:formate hydrogenlyase transcriptional activator